MKLFGKIALGATAVLAVALTVAAVSFLSWKGELVRTLESGSRIATTAKGDIEYAVVGEGTPSLYIHGSPGGYDQGLAGRNAYPELYKTTRTISASRPGYLRTPLSSGETFEQQADLFAALLDELKIDRAVVVAGSGGGYIGLQFALRHPDRCIGLVLISPSVNYEPLPPEGAPNPNDMRWLFIDLAMWAAPGQMGESMMKDFDPHDTRQVAYAKAIMPAPVGARVAGARNDTLQRIDPAIDRWPLEKISVPTLLIHGNADENSDYRGSVYVASKIPNAKLVTFEGGDHFIPITRTIEVNQHVRDFVVSLTATPPQPAEKETQ